MDLVQLRYFREVAKYEHMTQAAGHLHVTQPFLSKVIAHLESELGVKLFDREGKSIKLNSYGATLLKYSERIFSNLDELHSEIADLSGGKIGAISVGTSFPSREPHWLLSVTRNFLKENPKIKFSMYQKKPTELQDSLENREIDIAVSTAPIQTINISWSHLFTERMGIILSSDHPLASKEVISMTDLTNEQFLCNNANSDVQDLTRSFCRKAGFNPQVFYEGEFPLIIGEAISNCAGVSFISEPSFRLNNQKLNKEPWEEKIIFRNIKEDYCKRSCGFAILKGRYLTTATKSFIKYMLAHFDKKI